MQHLIDTLGGIGELVRLGLRSGFKMDRPYWKWRAETAFGHDESRRPSFGLRMRAVLAYGRWVYRMKRLR